MISAIRRTKPLLAVRLVPHHGSSFTFVVSIATAERHSIRHLSPRRSTPLGTFLVMCPRALGICTKDARRRTNRKRPLKYADSEASGFHEG